MRNLNWDGCLNVRDLGGLKTEDGRETTFGQFVRADGLDQLNASGVAQMQEYGISTIIDMRDSRERNADLEYAGVRRLHVPLEDQSDEEFWQEWRAFNCTPLYYKPFLEHCPERVMSVFAAIAEAGPGGIVFHCGAGRDRTGLISMLLLRLVGVTPAEVWGDYLLSQNNLKPLNRVKEEQAIAAAFVKFETDVETTLYALSKDLDVRKYLSDCGISDAQIERIKARLLCTI
ncbi:MAG TPA: tyrosine-protein phosphatase [Drouetiella sp.]